MLPWYLLGGLGYHNKIKLWLGGILGSFAMIGIGLYCFRIISVGNTLYTYLKYPLSAACILGIISLARQLHASSFLKYMGQNSMAIYLLHQHFYSAGTGIILFDVLGLPAVVSIVLTFILSILLPLATAR